MPSPYPIETDKACGQTGRETGGRSRQPKAAVKARLTSRLPRQPPPTKPAQIRRYQERRVQSSAAKKRPNRTDADVFAGIAQDERLKLQAALLWSGDYTGAVNGDDPMLTAVKNFQKRNKSKVTGQLDRRPNARELLAAAHDHEQEFGWSVVADPATGIRIGLPTKMVPHAREAAHGTRWSSRHGEVQVETFRLADPDLKLSALFEREKKEPARARSNTACCATIIFSSAACRA